MRTPCPCTASPSLLCSAALPHPAGEAAPVISTALPHPAVCSFLLTHSLSQLNTREWRCGLNSTKHSMCSPMPKGKEVLPRMTPSPAEESVNLHHDFPFLCFRLVHLCHGATGLVLLLCKCHEVFSAAEGVSPPPRAGGSWSAAADDCLAQALRMSDVVWDRGLLRKVRGGQIICSPLL